MGRLFLIVTVTIRGVGYGKWLVQAKIEGEQEQVREDAEKHKPGRVDAHLETKALGDKPTVASYSAHLIRL